MSGYNDYFKQQQLQQQQHRHHQQQHQRAGGGGGGRSSSASPILHYNTNNGGPSAADYDPLELHTAALAQQQQQQQHQHLALLAMPLANYPNLFAFAPPPPLPDHHHQLHVPHHGTTSATNRHPHTIHNSHQSQQQQQQHHHHHLLHQRHDSFDDLAAMVHQPQLDWSSALPVPAPVVTTSSAAAAAAAIFPPPPSTNSSPLAAYFAELSHHERWLEELQLEVKDISIDPLSGTEVLQRLREKLNDVLYKYIPCVSFLVDCQQSLRKGLERRRISAPQYYRLYVDHLPGDFCRKNLQMDGNTLTEAYNGLLQLRSEAAGAQAQGSEAVKSNFLGGMKDGESWGLRKWLSRHGGALHVCTDVECIVSVCRLLAPPALARLSEILRPAGKTVLHKLQTEIPSSYQAHSTAHPYLPYFHRLEAALRNLSTLGEANDIICLDSDDDDASDDDVQLVVPPPAPVAPAAKKTAAVKRKPAVAAAAAQPPQQRRKRSRMFANVPDDVVDDDDDDEVDNGSLETKPPARKMAKQPVFIKQDEDDDDEEDGHHHHGNNDNNRNHHHNTNHNNENDDDDDDDGSSSGESCDDAVEVIDNHPWPFQTLTDSGLVRRLINQVYQLADAWEANQLMRPPHVHASQFWRGNRFAEALRLFAGLLLDARPQQATMSLLAAPTDDNACVKAGQPPFSHVIKHPIAFRCIVNSLVDRTGSLPDKSLASWNMFDGKDMLQAIDLVLLNSLAYGKMVNAENTVRQEVNHLRRVLWTGIQKIGPRKTDQPTRRTEGSGFVVYRIR